MICRIIYKTGSIDTHAIRASVTAMQKVFAQIISDGGIQNVNDEIVPVSEIFRLQKMDEVKANEERFLR